MEQTLSAYNIVDIVAAVVVLIGLLRGLKRGLSGELAGLLSAAMAVGAGCYFYEPLGEITYAYTRLSEKAAYALAFLLAVFAAYVVMLILGIVLRHILEFTCKGKIERIGGMLCGLITSTVMTAAVIFMLGLWPHDYLHQLFVERSLVGRTLHRVLPTAYEELTETHPNLPRLPDLKASRTKATEDSETDDDLGPVEE